jgi:hypothetical protein
VVQSCANVRDELVGRCVIGVQSFRASNSTKISQILNAYANKKVNNSILLLL